MVPFQNDGPIQVSAGNYETFMEFCKTQHPNFDRLYHESICGRNAVGFRRLCVRSLLRPYGFRSADLQFLNITMQLSRIFRIGGRDTKSELYWTLYNRPSVLNMFTS